MNNKVRSDNNKTSNSFSKTLKNGIIATSLLFTLGSQPTESKTVEKNINPIEMTSEKSASPTVENVEQQTTPDYISQVEAGIKKYYPQYADYFKTMLEVIDSNPADIKYKINNIIEDNFELFEDDIVTEKDKITTILMFYENFLGKNYFSTQNEVKKISNDLGYDIRYSAAKEISSGLIKNIGKQYQEGLQIELEIFNEKKIHNEKWRNGDNSLETMQGDIEKTLTIRIKLFDKNIMKRNEMKNNKAILIDIKNYIEICKRTRKKPSPIGQKFIDEYNKIK